MNAIWIRCFLILFLWINLLLTNGVEIVRLERRSRSTVENAGQNHPSDSDGSAPSMTRLLTAMAGGNDHALGEEQPKDMLLLTQSAIDDMLVNHLEETSVDKHGNGYHLLDSTVNKEGTVVVHAEQQFMGIPVLGSRIVDVTEPSKLKLLKSKGTGKPIRVAFVPGRREEYGKACLGIEQDLGKNLKANDYRPDEAVRNLTAKATGTPELAEGMTTIYVDEKTNKAKVGYVVSMFDNNPENPSIPTQVIDADTGEIVDSWDNLETFRAQRQYHQGYGVERGEGPGGNEKTGKYQFGVNKRPYIITDMGNGWCRMETRNVKVVNLNHDPSSLYAKKQAVEFRCYDQHGDAINGAYSPINDAMDFGEKIYAMYLDWYGEPPLHNKDGSAMQLVLKTHYSKYYQNAYWNTLDKSMVFGDGGSYMFPLVGLDIAAHEIAHGVTSLSSALEYRRESGGLNEAFSDMAGKAAERYARGKNGVNWAVGADVVKVANESLRRMDEPWKGKSGREIGHMRDLQPSTPVHYSSGIFNRAFYLMSQKFDYDVWDAFDLFYIANTRFWTSQTTFLEGAELMLKAAEEIKTGKHLESDYSHIIMQDVVDSFKAVGISCTKSGVYWTCVKTD